jgi:hypothetical protein
MPIDEGCTVASMQLDVDALLFAGKFFSTEGKSLPAT